MRRTFISLPTFNTNCQDIIAPILCYVPPPPGDTPLNGRLITKTGCILSTTDTNKIKNMYTFIYFRPRYRVCPIKFTGSKGKTGQTVRTGKPFDKSLQIENCLEHAQCTITSNMFSNYFSRAYSKKFPILLICNEYPFCHQGNSIVNVTSTPGHFALTMALGNNLYSTVCHGLAVQ